MPADLLATLKDRLAEQQAIVAAASRYIDDLETAISAIESKRSHEPNEEAANLSPAVSPPQKPAHGELTRIALECVRNGKGTKPKIKEAFEERGLAFSRHSVENVIQRLKDRIRFDTDKNRFVLRDEAIEVNDRDQLMRDLEESNKVLEGSRADTLKPPGSNGASVHSPTTAIHVAST